jgi:Polyketide cyclase / dehydrase and lipid transport
MDMHILKSSKHFFSAAGLRYTLEALLLVYSGFLCAEQDIHEVEVTEQGGVYHINASVVINAEAEYVHQVLVDFVHIYRLNPSIIESDVLDTKDGQNTDVRTRVLGCAGYFCQELERVEKVRQLPSGDLVAEIVPEKSEFRSGKTVWHIEPMGERSRIVYESEMEPDFYIPPVVGKFMAKKSIHTEITTSFQNLEKIANVLAERDWNSDFTLSSRLSSTLTPCDLATR